MELLVGDRGQFLPLDNQGHKFRPGHRPVTAESPVRVATQELGPLQAANGLGIPGVSRYILKGGLGAGR